MLDALRRITLLDGLDDQHLEVFATRTLRKKYGRGETIFSRGDSGDRAYVILSGAVDLVIESPDGRELILARLEDNEHFGEMALLDDQERSATARASEPTELLVILRENFLQVLQQSPDMSREIIRALIQRLRVADEKLEALAYLDAEGRIARMVLDLAREDAGSISVSHEELGHMAATSRQTTTKILGEWEELGYVQLVRRGVNIQDRRALEILAQL
jgi:CRP-like cAMP-binding protein